MIFGSISYLNLLPFQVFLKKALPNSQFQHSVRYGKATPNSINKSFKNRRINAAFISSVKSVNCRCSNIGIVADGSVYSVFVALGEEKIDEESATSNQLAKVLGLKGEVSIGDKALKAYLSGYEAIDLAEQWKEETGLPFVFARLCFNRYKKKINSLAHSFQRVKIKIPQTVLKKEASLRGIKPKELQWYLEHIYYKIDYKAEKSLKLFLKKVRKR